MIIRKAKLKDIKNMKSLWLELMNFHKNLDRLYYERSKNALKMFKSWIRKNVLSKNSMYLVAEDDKNLIGYIGGSIEKRPPVFKIEKNAFIQEAVVTKKYRNKGVGGKLTSELFKWFKLKNVKFVELRAISKNTKGIAAWQKMGFKEQFKVMKKDL